MLNWIVWNRTDNLYKMDLALNNIQELICHKTQTTKQPTKSQFGLMFRVFANGQGDQGSIPGRVIPKTQKMVLDASLLNTQHYKVRIKGKVEQSWERSSALPYISVYKLSKREPSIRPLLKGDNLYFNIQIQKLIFKNSYLKGKTFLNK